MLPAENGRLYMSNSVANALFIVTLALLSAFGPFVTDMYLPALPSLSEAFGTSDFWVKMSMSICMIGLAVGQIFVGPLSDKYGRRGPLMFSMWLFVLSTAGCVFATDIYFFVLMRFFQGVAGAGGIALSRSISADNYTGLELARFLAMIAAVHSVAPVAAPIIGGITLSFFSWRVIFVCLLVLGVVLMGLSYRIKESLPKNRRSNLSAIAIFSLYKNVVYDKVALFYILQQGAMAIILFAYICSSPFIFEDMYGVKPIVFSCIFAANAIAIAVGAMISSKFRRRRTAVVVSGIGIFAGAILESVMIVSGQNIYLVEGMLFVMLAFFGLAAPAAAAIVLDSQHKNAGTAAALLGALPFAAGSLAAPCIGMGDVAVDFSIVIISGGALSAVLALIARNYQKKYGPSTM